MRFRISVVEKSFHRHLHTPLLSTSNTDYLDPPRQSPRVCASCRRRFHLGRQDELWWHLARATLEGLSEDEKLSLCSSVSDRFNGSTLEGLLTIVDGQDTGTGNTTENVGTSTLEERSETFGGKDLSGSIERTLVLDGLQNRLDYCHGTTSDCSEYLPHQTSSSCDDGWYQEDRKRYRHQW